MVPFKRQTAELRGEWGQQSSAHFEDALNTASREMWYISDNNNGFGSLLTENTPLWDGLSSNKQEKFQIPLKLAWWWLENIDYPQVLKTIWHKCWLLVDYLVFKSTIKIQVRFARDATNLSKYPLKWIMESFPSV
jgi:hypothetical protein